MNIHMFRRFKISRQLEETNNNEKLPAPCQTKPFFASFICQFSGQATPGASDLLLHQHAVLDQLPDATSSFPLCRMP